MLAEIQLLSKSTAELAAASLWPLSDDEITDCLKAAHRLEQTAAVLQTQLVRQAGSRRLPARHGSRTVTAWLRETLLLDPQPAREITEQAAALTRQPLVEQAVLDGHLDLRQAVTIAATLDAIPADLTAATDPSATDPSATDPSAANQSATNPSTADPSTADQSAADPSAADLSAADPSTDSPDDHGNPAGRGEPAGIEISALVDQAGHTMIDMATRLPAYQLRRIGERILAYVAPHIADQIDAAALTRQEARAHRRRGFTLSLPVDGMVRLSGQLGTEDAATIRAALHPLCRPTPGDNRTPPQRRADALTDICRLTLRTRELPDDGGEPPQVAVTVAYNPLTQALGIATADTGERFSPTTARRLACDARILPIILGSNSQILDAGRTRRLATGTLRRALHIRDRGCAFPDCDRPPRWTDAHHCTAWTAGGATELNNLVLLCRYHHRLIHHPSSGWKIRFGPDHHPDFIPPPHIDPQQRPRRNLYHPRQ